MEIWGEKLQKNSLSGKKFKPISCKKNSLLEEIKQIEDKKEKERKNNQEEI